MRVKSKVHCDYCGIYLFTFNKKEYTEVLKKRNNGARVNCGYICDDCLKERK